MAIDKEAREAAREQINVAIKNYLEVVECLDPAEEMVNHWGIVVNMLKVEDDAQSHYVTLFSSHGTPVHVSKGLFWVALNESRKGRGR